MSFIDNLTAEEKVRWADCEKELVIVMETLDAIPLPENHELIAAFYDQHIYRVLRKHGFPDMKIGGHNFVDQPNVIQ